nr:hypothetical protein [Tanacetum cinerariifolium]
AYLMGTDTKSEPFGDLVETETPESPHTVASPTSLPGSTPPTRHVEESEGYGTSGARSTSLDSTAPLSPDYPLTHTTPALLPSLRRTARIAVCVLPAMSPSLSASKAKVAAMSDLAFRKSEGEESGGEEDEKVEESLDFDSESEDAKDEGPNVGNKGPTIGDEGLAAGYGSPIIRVKSLGLGRDETIPVGQGSGSVPEPERPEGVLALRQPTLTTWIDLEDGRTYIDVPAYHLPAPPIQTPPSPEWSPGSLPVSPAPSIVSLPISSPMISLTVPSPATLQRELQEMRGRVTALEQERDNRIDLERLKQIMMRFRQCNGLPKKSAVTYTSISSDSDGPSWGIPLMNAGEFSKMDPYEKVEDDDKDLEEDPSEEHEPEDDDDDEDLEEDPNEEHEPEDFDETEPFEEDETAVTPPPPRHRGARISVRPQTPMATSTQALIDAFVAVSSLFPLPPTSPVYDQASLGHKASMIRKRDDIPEEDMPPWRRFAFTAPPHRCDIPESSVDAAAARAPMSQYDFADTVEARQGLICSFDHDARTIARAADRVEDVDYVRALQASERRMMTFIKEVNLRADHRDIRLEIDVVKGQRTAYETEPHEHQSAKDLVVTQMMLIHALEARAQTNTVKDASSSC